MRKERFRIDEMDCAEESLILKAVLSRKKGIKHLDFDILSRKMSVTYDPNLIDSQAILGLIASTGMRATLWEETLSLSFWQTHKRFLLCSLSALFLVIAYLFSIKKGFFHFDLEGNFFSFPPFWSAVFYCLAIVCSGSLVCKKALVNLRHFSFDMHVLMLIAVMGAIAIGQLAEAATVIFLFSIALLLESWSVDKARKAISSLLDLSPILARVLVLGKIVEKKVEEVAIGDIILIRPGEKIPLDGQILSGSSFVNQAPLTGEATPVFKKPSDLVLAGTLNEEGALEVLVTKEVQATTLAQIIRLVEEGRQNRAKSEEWVTRFSKVYTPCMLCAALSFALFAPLFLHEPWALWIYRGLVLIVVACPCALVISTPVSIVSALTSAARFGVLIKGGIYLELIGKLTALALDKTGTATIGKPKVEKIALLQAKTEEELLTIAASLEAMTTHPFALAILEKAKERNLSFFPVTHFKIFPGLGAEGFLNGKKCWVGNHRFIHDKRYAEDQAAHTLALQLEDAGHSVVAVGDETAIYGFISLADQPRPHFQETLTTLKGLGIREIALLTGDNKKTATLFCKQTGISACFSELLPQDKLAIIQEMKKTYPIVAMVGDGVNDAPAMAASSIGIAMGLSGTDTAFETADIVLMTDNLAQLPQTIRHARRTKQIILQNISFSLGIKAIFIILALTGFATLWMAIAADTGASLLVVFNGMRLLRTKSWKFREKSSIFTKERLKP